MQPKLDVLLQIMGAAGTRASLTWPIWVALRSMQLIYSYLCTAQRYNILMVICFFGQKRQIHFAPPVQCFPPNSEAQRNMKSVMNK